MRRGRRVAPAVRVVAVGAGVGTGVAVEVGVGSGVGVGLGVGLTVSPSCWAGTEVFLTEAGSWLTGGASLSQSFVSKIRSPCSSRLSWNLPSLNGTGCGGDDGASTAGFSRPQRRTISRTRRTVAGGRLLQSPGWPRPTGSPPAQRTGRRTRGRKETPSYYSVVHTSRLATPTWAS